MRRTLLLTLFATIIPAAALLAQTGTLPQIVNRSFNPALYQQRAEAVAPTLSRFSQSDALGLNGALMNNGGGGNFHYQWPLQKEVTATLDLALVYLDFDNPFLPFYSSRYRSADVMLVPMFLGLRRDIFRENFDNTVLPYIQFGAGPLAGMAFPYGYGFWESVRRSHTAWTVGGFAGAGFNFAVDKKTAALVDFRYNIMIFPDTIGPRNDYSGPSISFGVLRGF